MRFVSSSFQYVPECVAQFDGVDLVCFGFDPLPVTSLYEVPIYAVNILTISLQSVVPLLLLGVSLSIVLSFLRSKKP